MLGLHVLNLRLFKFEKAVTILAVMASWASYVVSLSPRVEALKFGVTVIAIAQQMVVWEQLLTANTIRGLRTATQARPHTLSLLRIGIGGLRDAYYSSAIPGKQGNDFCDDSDERCAGCAVLVLYCRQSY